MNYGAEKRDKGKECKVKRKEVVGFANHRERLMEISPTKVCI